MEPITLLLSLIGVLAGAGGVVLTNKVKQVNVISAQKILLIRPKKKPIQLNVITF